MAINFPNNPAVNDTFTVGGTKFTFTGDKWESGAVVELSSDTTPQLGGELNAGTHNINNAGVITATAFHGDGSNLTGVTDAAANTYGNSTAVPQIVVGANGRITGITTMFLSVVAVEVVEPASFLKIIKVLLVQQALLTLELKSFCICNIFWCWNCYCTIAGINTSGISEFTHLNVSGLSTLQGNIDANGDLDVDGNTELDQLNVSGVSTFTGGLVDVQTSGVPAIISNWKS